MAGVSLCSAAAPWLSLLATGVVLGVLPVPFWQAADSAKWNFVVKTLRRGAPSGRPPAKKNHDLNPCETSRMHLACLFDRTAFCAASRRKPLESRGAGR